MNVRPKLGFWLGVAFLAAGCTAPAATPPPTVTEQTDVWFAQHLVPHLLQDTSIADLSHDRLTHPALAQLADRLQQRDQAYAAQVIDWLARRGLAPHGHSHQRGDTLRRSDLERLSRLTGTALDQAFVNVMVTRYRAGRKLAITETRDGNVPEIRQLAAQLLAEQQADTRELQTWTRARSKA